MNTELQKKVDRAIRLIQAAGEIASQHGQPLEVCYSGGKDSDVILELTKMSGVEYRAIYKNTTIDPPGTIKHAKDNGVEVRQPKMTFMQVLETAGLVSRFRRSCCDKLKEYKILDYAVIGVRRDESAKRAERYKEPEICPLASKKQRLEEFRKYPKMARFYIRGGQTFLDSHPDSKIHGYFKDAYEWFAFSLTCDSLEEFRIKFGKDNLFGEGIDCKTYLEKIIETQL